MGIYQTASECFGVMLNLSSALPTRQKVWVCVSIWLQRAVLWDFPESDRLANTCLPYLFLVCPSLHPFGWLTIRVTLTLTEIAIDGSWSCWGLWSSCSGRMKSRTRQCNNPEPSRDGAACWGLAEESFPCWWAFPQFWKTEPSAGFNLSCWTMSHTW